MPRIDATTRRVVATVVGSGKATCRDTPRCTGTESVGRTKERAFVASTAGRIAQTLRGTARSKRPIETDGLAATAERLPGVAACAGQRLLA